MKKSGGTANAPLLLVFLLALLAAGFWLKPENPAEPAVEAVDYVSGVEGVYQYPVLPGTQAWLDLETTAARYEACQVPREALDAMTTEALAETAAAYPFNMDMYAYDDFENFESFETGYQAVLRRSSALAALAERPDRHEAVAARLDAMRDWEEALPAGQQASTDTRFKMEFLAIFSEYME